MSPLFRKLPRTVCATMALGLLFLSHQSVGERSDSCASSKRCRRRVGLQSSRRMPCAWRRVGSRALKAHKLEAYPIVGRQTVAQVPRTCAGCRGTRPSGGSLPGGPVPKERTCPQGTDLSPRKADLSPSEVWSPSEVCLAAEGPEHGRGHPRYGTRMPRAPLRGDLSPQPGDAWTAKEYSPAAFEK